MQSRFTFEDISEPLEPSPIMQKTFTVALLAFAGSAGALQIGVCPRTIAPAVSSAHRMPAPALLFGIGEKDKETVAAGTGGGEEKEDSKALMQKVKDAGVAGIISYVFWEWAFWGISVPIALFGFREVTGAWPDFSNQDDMAKLVRGRRRARRRLAPPLTPAPPVSQGAEAFAFVNVARFAVPLRIGLALGTTPWVQSNIVDRFQKKDDK